MNFKENLIEMFAFTRGERKGIVVVLILLCALVVYRYFYAYRKIEHPELFTLKDQLINWPAESKSDSTGSENYSFHETPDKLSFQSNLFPFDPNTISDEEWKKLGLFKGQIRSIRNFLGKGGKFRVKKDLSKMYVISPEVYARLEPYILLPDDHTSEKTDKSEATKTAQYPERSLKDESIILEINSADSFDFRKLKGIGPYLSRKIIAYREKLGGFYSIEQLKEVYRMEPGRVDSLQYQLRADSSLIAKIQINRIDAALLSSHPYLSKQQARALIAYRDRHGPFKNTSDIRKCVLIDEKTYQKIVPYLTVD